MPFGEGLLEQTSTKGKKRENVRGHILYSEKLNHCSKSYLRATHLKLPLKHKCVLSLKNCRTFAVIMYITEELPNCI